MPQAPYDLHVLDVATRSVAQLTQGENGDQESFCWSPTSDEIAVVRNTAPTPDLNAQRHRDFCRLSLRAIGRCLAASRTEAERAAGTQRRLSWSPDGRRIAYLGHDDPEEVWGVRNVHVWVVGATSDTQESARDLTPDWDFTCGSTLIGDVSGGGESGPVWSDDSQSVLVLASDRGGVELYRIALIPGEGTDNGNAPVALDPEQTRGCGLHCRCLTGRTSRF